MNTVITTLQVIFITITVFAAIGIVLVAVPFGKIRLVDKYVAIIVRSYVLRKPAKRVRTNERITNVVIFAIFAGFVPALSVAYAIMTVSAEFYARGIELWIKNNLETECSK